MDTSKTYIKMCEKAIEIQFAWKGGLGDIVRHQGRGIIYYTKPSDLLQGDGCIWLPRQDQLQEILNYEESSSYPVSHLLIKLNEFYSQLDWWEGKDGDGGDITWEQLWLAFVMKEKYNKTWNENEWVG